MTPLRRHNLTPAYEPAEQYTRLALVSAGLGFLCAILCGSLKKLTVHYEQQFLGAAKAHPALFMLFPACGLFMIFFLKQYLFKKKAHQGIREVIETLRAEQGDLPAYQVPFHYINGLLTVAFGGSTGVEVPAMVASAAVGSFPGQKLKLLGAYKKELICAAMAAAITALFSSPLGGILFSLEVLTKKVSRAFVLCLVAAVGMAWLLNGLFGQAPLFSLPVAAWHTHAIPYFILLGVIAGFNSAYLTRSILFFRKQFHRFGNSYLKIAAGSVIISIMLLLFPQLYGEGYQAVKEFSQQPGQLVFNLPLLLTLAGLVILKPVITSVTLATGGDGGVFAPSIFMGAFLGLLVSGILNTFFHTEVVPLNFMIIGMAAVLSSSIHAPFTAVFLVCGLIGSYALIIPIFIGCAISKLTSMMVFPYTVYAPPAAK